MLSSTQFPKPISKIKALKAIDGFFLSENHYMAVKSIEDFWWAILGTYMSIFLFYPLCSHVFTNFFFK